MTLIECQIISAYNLEFVNINVHNFIQILFIVLIFYACKAVFKEFATFCVCMS